jgi:AcrR family transcriptional regulator
MSADMLDRRQDIIMAGLAVLRERGLAGFTQPRVAKLAGLRQSHLTYYFPTRLDLLAAVARAAIDGQLGAIDAMLDPSSSVAAAASIARVAVRHENTRVMMALAQSADEASAVRDLFRELADGIIARVGRLLERLGVEATEERRYLIHALSVGIAVIDLATARKDGERRAQAAIQEALDLLLVTGAGRPAAEDGGVPQDELRKPRPRRHSAAARAKRGETR